MESGRAQVVDTYEGDSMLLSLHSRAPSVGVNELGRYRTESYTNNECRH